MSFIDKVTAMRRCAIINPYSGDIEWEGVKIANTFVLKNVDTDAVMIKSQQEFDDWLDFENSTVSADYILVYQDEDISEWWCPIDKLYFYNSSYRKHKVLKSPSTTTYICTVNSKDIPTYYKIYKERKMADFLNDMEELIGE